MYQQTQYTVCDINCTNLPPVSIALALLGHHVGLLLAKAQLLSSCYHLCAVILTLRTIPALTHGEKELTILPATHYFTNSFENGLLLPNPHHSSDSGTPSSGGVRHQRWYAMSHSSHRICFSGLSFPPHTLHAQCLHFRLGLSLHQLQSGFFIRASPSPSSPSHCPFCSDDSRVSMRNISLINLIITS